MSLTRFGFWCDDHPVLAAVLYTLAGYVLTYPVAFWLGHPQPGLIAATLPVLALLAVGPLCLLALLALAALGFR